MIPHRQQLAARTVSILLAFVWVSAIAVDVHADESLQPAMLDTAAPTSSPSVSPAASPADQQSQVPPATVDLRTYGNLQLCQYLEW